MSTFFVLDFVSRSSPLCKLPVVSAFAAATLPWMGEGFGPFVAQIWFRFFLPSLPRYALVVSVFFLDVFGDAFATFWCTGSDASKCFADDVPLFL